MMEPISMTNLDEFDSPATESSFARFDFRLNDHISEQQTKTDPESAEEQEDEESELVNQVRLWDYLSVLAEIGSLT